MNRRLARGQWIGVVLTVCGLACSGSVGETDPSSVDAAIRADGGATVDGGAAGDATPGPDADTSASIDAATSGSPDALIAPDATVVSCVGPTADCNHDPADGCEVDLHTTANCGSCGNNCGGGSCVAGLCVVEVLSGIIQAGNLDAEGDYIYYCRNSSSSILPNGVIYRVLKAGGTPESLVSSIDIWGRFDVVGDTIYWKDFVDGYGDRVMRRAITGTSAQELAKGTFNANGFMVQGSYVYFGDARSTAGTPAGSVMRVPIGGGAAVKLATGLADPYSVAVGGGAVYWAESALNVGGKGDGSISRLMNSATTVLVTNRYSPGSLRLAAGTLYWRNLGDVGLSIAGSIESRDSGGTIKQLATNQGSPSEIEVAGGYVYWITWDGAGVLRRVPIGGGTVETLFQDPKQLVFLEVDDAIYLTRAEGSSQYTLLRVDLP